MEKALDKLNEIPEIISSFVVANDGIIVTARMAPGIDADAVGALASAVVNTVNKASLRLGQGLLKTYAIETEHSKMFFSPFRRGCLVTITAAKANLGLVRMEMKTAIRSLNSARL